MAKIAKNAKIPKGGKEAKLEKVDPASYPEGLVDDCIQHQKDSETWLATVRDTWDDKESMLIGIVEDGLSKKSKNKVFDGRLSTIVFERAARVMAQNPKGKAYAVDKDDVGKNMIMNLLLEHSRKNANEQYSHLIKLRLLDLYSLVYGTMFALVPWRVNLKNGYIGPELLLLPIRDCFPQPGQHNLEQADWFTVRTVSSADWLKQQDPKTWNMDNINALCAELKEAKDNGDDRGSPQDQNKTSYVERTYFPSTPKDVVFPRVELFTEYRSDMWITWAANKTNKETSKAYILRVVKNPYPEKMLPIVAKHAFPLIDSPIGLGEFERGKSLQFALNSLINLYLDGVKYSIFPPLAINADNVVPSSIKWGAGERWFMNQPNVDVQPVNLSPKGMDTFNSTYGFMLSALYNQSGTSEVSQSENVDSSLGKTPQALRLQAGRESARDEWDRFMMEETIKEIYRRWIALYANNLEAPVALRLFKEQIGEIKKLYPDEFEEFNSGERGQIKATKKMLGNGSVSFDYDLESGSTMKPNLEGDQNNLTTILKAVVENPSIVQALAQRGKTVDIGELFKRWIVAGGTKDWEKVIIDIPKEQLAGVTPNTIPGQPEVTPEEAAAGAAPNQLPPEVQQMLAEASAAGGAPAPGQAPMPEAAPPMPMQDDVVPVQQAAPMPQAPAGNLKDPEIAALAAQLLGGTAGIPPQQ